jgi:hypothetical protein
VSELRIPPDGVIARVFTDLEEGLNAGCKRYMRDCLLHVMRDEPMRSPLAEYKLKAIDGVFVRQRAQELAPRLEAVRSGEERLPAAPVQESIPF